jgi:hypothetical protein
MIYIKIFITTMAFVAGGLYLHDAASYIKEEKIKEFILSLLISFCFYASTIVAILEMSGVFKEAL